MARRKGGEQEYVDRAEFEELLRANVAEAKRSYATYEHAVMVLSALDSSFHAKWGRKEVPVRLTERVRFPKLANLTPDFVFTFANGYRVLVEHKKVWNLQSQEKILAQLGRYKALSAEEFGGNPGIDETKAFPAGCSHDVVLLVGEGSDEQAAEAIAEHAELGPGSVVVFDVTYQGARVNDERILLTWRKSGGANGQFCAPNVGGDDPALDLNEPIFARRPIPLKCDAETLALSADCPFINDDPPIEYAAVKLVLDQVVLMLTEDQKDLIASGAEVIITFTVEQVRNAASERYPEIPAGKLSSWINAAVEGLSASKLLTTNLRAEPRSFSVRIGERMDKLKTDKFLEGMARAKVLLTHLPIRRRVDDGQLQFDFGGIAPGLSRDLGD